MKDVLLKAQIDDFGKYIYKDVMGDEMWNKPLSPSEKIEQFNLLKEGVEKEYVQDVENFLPILFNQTLVVFCTVFEMFLIDSLDVITKLKPETIKILSTKEYKDILDAIEKNIDISRLTVFSIVRKKILERFDFKSIDKKFNTFEAIGLKRSAIFKLNEKMTVKYPNAEKFLKEIYRKRNDIVHKNMLPIKEYQDIENISEFLNHFIFKFSLDAYKVFGIKLDFQLTILGQKA